MTLPDDSKYCCYCGVEFNSLNYRKQKTVDHLIPLSKGGANNPYNKRNCCNHCNTQKGSLMPLEYLNYLLQDYQRANTASAKGNLEIKIENVRYIIEYVNSAGEKIFSNQGRYGWFKRRYLKVA